MLPNVFSLIDKQMDRYEDALKAVIAAEQKGQKPITSEELDNTNVIDLMAALKASLAGKKAIEVDKKPATKPKNGSKSKSRKANRDICAVRIKPSSKMDKLDTRALPIRVTVS
jgi:hypothetical protein